MSGGSATNMATGTEEQFVREIECCGRVLRLYQDFVGDVGCVVWDAALVLGRFLENKTFFPSDYWSSNKRVLELGAGTGAVGLIAALLG